MKWHLAIVTGASRGLGLALTQQLLARADTHVLAIARHQNEALGRDRRLEQWALDLSQPTHAAQRLAGWLAERDAGEFDRATLINNAAVLATPGPLAERGFDELAMVLRVGLEAPLLLSAAFLRSTRGWNAQRRILNISSGLGRRATAGQAAYCAIKAGMDHFSRAVALEGVSIASLAPGVIDTDMQMQLRASDPRAFPDRERFVEMKSRGTLDSPAVAAQQVLAYLGRSDFGANPVADVRDAR